MNFLQFAFNNVKRHARKYAAYFFSSAFAVMIFFLYVAFSLHPKILPSTVNDLVSGGMVLGAGSIVFFSFIFILYSTAVFVQARSQQFGILTILGMTKRQLRFMLFLEFSIIGVGSILTGTVTGLVFLKLFLIIASLAVGGSSMTFYFPINALETTAITYGILFIFISPLSYLFIGRQPLMELLTVRRRKLRFRNSSYIFATIALCCLIWSYVQAFRKDVGTFLIAFMVIHIGLYGLFRHVLPIVMRWMKKIRSLFWRKTNLLKLSETELRIRENGLMFYLLTILWTITCLCVVVLVSIRFLMDVTPNKEPFQLYYVSNLNNPKQDTHIQYIEQSLKETGVTYSKQRIPLLRFTTTPENYVDYFMRYQDYVRLGEFYKSPITPLHEGEALWLSRGKDNMAKNRTSIQIPNHSSSLQLLKPPDTKKNWMPELKGKNGSVLVITDSLYKELAANTAGESMTFFGYQFTNSSNALTLFALVEKGLGQDGVQDRYQYSLAAYYEYLFQQMPYIVIFIGLFITAVFFTAGASFVYFKIYSDLNKDLVQFRALYNIGVSIPELYQIVKTRVVLMMGLPSLFAILNSAGLLLFIKQQDDTMFKWLPFIVSFVLFILIQTCFSLILRKRYWAHIVNSLK